MRLQEEPPKLPDWTRDDFRKSVYNPFVWASFVSLFNKLGLNVMAYNEKQGAITGILVKSSVPFKVGDEFKDEFTISFVRDSEYLTIEEIEEQIPKEIWGYEEYLERRLKETIDYLRTLMNLPPSQRKEYVRRLLGEMKKNSIWREMQRIERKRKEGAARERKEVVTESTATESEEKIRRTKKISKSLKDSAAEQRTPMTMEELRLRAAEQREKLAEKIWKYDSPWNAYYKEVGQYMNPRDYVKSVPKPSELLFPRVDGSYGERNAMIMEVTEVVFEYVPQFLMHYYNSWVIATNIKKVEYVSVDGKGKILQGSEVPSLLEGILKRLYNRITLVIREEGDDGNYYLKLGDADILIRKEY